MKKNNRALRKQDALDAQDRILTVPFHKVSVVTLTGGAGNTPVLVDTFGNRAVAIADDFGFYRLKELRYRIRASQTATGMVSMCFFPGIVDTLPNTLSLISENVHAAYLGVRETVPSQWVVMKGVSTKTYFPWLKTKAGSLDPSEEQAGIFAFVGGSTDSFTFEYEGLIQFRAPVDPGSTPMAEQKAVLRERERLMKILSFVPSKEPKPPGSILGATLPT